MRWMWVIVVVTASLSTATAAERPDILMIAIDDLRPMLGCYGDDRMHTPNIDQIAQRGVVFERAYCQYAKCGTSRLSLMTGMRPDTIGVFSNNVKDVAAFRRRMDIPSLARRLKQAGYHTRSFGKIYHDGWDYPRDWSRPSSPGREREMWEVVDEQDPAAPTTIAARLECPVMQSPDVDDEHLFAGRMVQEVIAALKQERTASAFMAVGFRRPHLPFVAPRRYFELYRPDESWLSRNPLPPRDAPVMAWFNSDGYVGSAKRVGLVMPKRPDFQQAVDWNGYEMRSYLGVPNRGPIDPSRQIELLHAYAACISYVDAQIGKLLTFLRDSKRLDQTVIVLWSDHGWHLGEHSAWGKMTNFEIATRVPLIIAGPGIEPANTRAIAELVDLYPTICELVGLDPPAHIEGQSLKPVLAEPDAERDSVALSQYLRFGEKYMGRAIRTDRHRFVLWTETATGRVVNRELYAHPADRAETVNVADSQSELVTHLERRLQQAFEQNGR